MDAQMLTIVMGVVAFIGVVVSLTAGLMDGRGPCGLERLAAAFAYHQRHLMVLQRSSRFHLSFVPQLDDHANCQSSLEVAPRQRSAPPQRLQQRRWPRTCAAGPRWAAASALA